MDYKEMEKRKTEREKIECLRQKIQESFIVTFDRQIKEGIVVSRCLQADSFS
jgi:hypothetical protein